MASGPLQVYVLVNSCHHTFPCICIILTSSVVGHFCVNDQFVTEHYWHFCCAVQHVIFGQVFSIFCICQDLATVCNDHTMLLVACNENYTLRNPASIQDAAFAANSRLVFGGRLVNKTCDMQACMHAQMILFSVLVVKNEMGGEGTGILALSWLRPVVLEALPLPTPLVLAIVQIQCRINTSKIIAFG